MGRTIRIFAGFLLAFAIQISSASLFAQQTLPVDLQATAESVIGGQINAFKARDHDRAFGFAAPNIRSIFESTDNFIRMVQSGYGAIYGAQSWSYGRAKVDGATIVQEVLIAGPDGRSWVALYTLSQQPDGSWKIPGVQLKQGEALST